MPLRWPLLPLVNAGLSFRLLSFSSPSQLALFQAFIGPRLLPCAVARQRVQHGGRSHPFSSQSHSSSCNVSHYAEVGDIPAGSIAGVILPDATKTDNLRGHNVSPLSLRSKSCSGYMTKGTFASLRLALIHPTPPHPTLLPIADTYSSDLSHNTLPNQFTCPLNSTEEMNVNRRKHIFRLSVRQKSDWSIFFILKNSDFSELGDFSSLAPLVRFVRVCACVNFALLRRYLFALFSNIFQNASIFCFGRFSYFVTSFFA